MNNNQEIKKSIKNGWKYLESQNISGFFECMVGSSRGLSDGLSSPPETSNILIEEVLLKYHPRRNISKDTIKYLKKLSNNELFTYFEDRSLYPPDSDFNAIGYSLLFELGYANTKEANIILNILLSNIDENGIVNVWITNSDRPKRIDHVVATNVIYLAYLLGREKETIVSEDWIYNILVNNEYQKGSRYYNSPDAFLFALSRLTSKFPLFNERFNKPLREHVENRIKEVEFIIDIAMLIIVAKSLDIPVDYYQNKLINMQNDDGSWQSDALFRFGSVNKYFGSQALTTAYAIRSLEIY